MKKLLALMIILTTLLCFSGCSAEPGDSVSGTASDYSSQQENLSTSEKPEEHSNVSEALISSDTADNSETSSDNSGKTLVVYFSRTGENYGVGVIEKGNTHIIADMIAEQTNADTFEIRTVNAYPEGYDECTNVARREKDENARPELAENLGDLDDYDTIFLGYPNWWGDMPMAVYTFIESHDFSGKTVAPFCTHAGSGLSGTVKTLKDKLSGASVLDGLAITGTTAQNSPDDAENAVSKWLADLEVVQMTN